MVKASYTNDLRENTKLCVFHLFVARAPQTFAASVLFLLIAVFFFVMGALSGNTAGYIAGAVLVAAAAGMPAIRFFLQRAKTQKTAKSNKNFENTQLHFEFYEDSFDLQICVRTQAEKYQIPYEQVLRIYETKTHFYIYIGGSKVLILPKDKITEGDADSLAMIFRALGKRFREDKRSRKKAG